MLIYNIKRGIDCYVLFYKFELEVNKIVCIFLYEYELIVLYITNNIVVTVKWQ